MKLGGFGRVRNYEAIQQAGYDYAEIDMVEVQELSAAEYDAFRARVEKAGFPIPTAIQVLPNTEPLFFVPGFRETSLEAYVRSTCQKNAQLGLKTILFGNGKVRRMVDPDSLQREDAFIRFLRMLCDIAGENGQQVLIEPLGPLYTNYINNLPEAARVIDKANMPNLFAMADLRHMIGAGEPLEDIVRYRDIVRHVHMDDPLSYPERKYPHLNNGYDYAPFFEQLRDYQGMLTVEAEIPEDWMRAGAELRELVQKYLPESTKRI